MNRTAVSSRHRKDGFEFSHKRKPSGFRVLLKNRSTGMNETAENLSHCSSQSVEDDSLAFRTQSSFGVKDEIKSFAKSLNSNKMKDSMLAAHFNNKVKDRESQSNGKFHKTQNERTKTQTVAERPKSRASAIESLNIDLLPQRQSPIRIEDLEKRLDDLIHHKLIKAKADISKGIKNKLFSSQKPSNDDLDIEMQRIVEELQQLSAEESEQTQLDTVDRKINLLEKIIAESATESEMVKKFYFSTNANRKPKVKKQYGSHTLMNLNESLRRLNSRQGKQNASVSSESINTVNYIAPNKEAYVIRAAKPKHEVNNQPLPRSSYGRDFLTYGNLPQFRYRPESSNAMATGVRGPQQSCYRSDFTQKRPQKFDFRQLDCFKDKFRNLKVSFTETRRLRTENDERSVNSRMQKYSATKQKQTQTRQQTEATHYIKDMKTENSLKYGGEKATIKSLIKHKNLSDLKYSFKVALQT